MACNYGIQPIKQTIQNRQAGEPCGFGLTQTAVHHAYRLHADVGQLVVDPFAGSMTTPLACELEDRPWVATEMVYDYVRGGAERFTEFPGYSCSLPAVSG